MNIPPITPQPLILITKIFVFLIVVPKPHGAAPDEQYSRCSEPYACETVPSLDIKYPFWGSGRPSYCGVQGFRVECDGNEHPIFNISSLNFTIQSIDRPRHTMRIAQANLWDKQCPVGSANINFRAPLANYTMRTENITLFYSCPTDILDNIRSRDKINCTNRVLVHRSQSSSIGSTTYHLCGNSIMVPVLGEHLEWFRNDETFTLLHLVEGGFEVSYELDTESYCRDCERSAGVCGTDDPSHEFTCFCKDGRSHPRSCQTQGKNPSWDAHNPAASRLSRRALGGDSGESKPSAPGPPSVPRSLQASPHAAGPLSARSRAPLGPSARSDARQATLQASPALPWSLHAHSLGRQLQASVDSQDSGPPTTQSSLHSPVAQRPQPSRQSGSSHVGRNIGIGFAAVGGTLLILGVAIIVYRSRSKRRNPAKTSWESRDITSYGTSMSDLEKSHSRYGVQVFDYHELEEATNNFDERKELGDGGFGIVYQGKLRDGRVVAVKRLYERNFKRVEQFMNEVEILTRLRHPNLVTLYGCTTRHSRELLLVYEYIPNGTLADHLHGEQAKPGSLSWTARMSIAMESASAIAFLHASDVVHRDVKTNNILLDNNFHVKVADFGLSRLYPTNVTHVSTAPQGTPGYVDPEYHQCYRLTTKSDVYSFGVVLVELISSMPAVDITRHRHDINLSSMAINMIQNRALHELVDSSLGFDSDIKVRKMIEGVAELAFCCLQNGRDMRPSMEEVLEVLRGINSEDYCAKVVEEMDVPIDDAVLPTSSSNSVVSNLISNKTTPNTSG